MSQFAITNVNVFDGRDALGRRTVLVRDGVISAVTTEAPPSDWEIVDGEGGTLLPGLIDSHVHLFEGGQSLALRFGVTTVLDLFCDPEKLKGYRADAASRNDVADIRSAGIGATAPGGHPVQMAEAGIFPPFPTVATPEQAAEFVAQRVAEGSNYLKMYFEDGFCTGHPGPMLDPDTAKALVQATRDHGILSVAHATTVQGATRAVEAGVSGLAHVWVDPAPYDQLLDDIVRSGMFVMPTLTPLDWVSGVSQRGEYLAQTQALSYLAPAEREALEAMPDYDPGVAWTGPQPSSQVAEDVTRKLRDAGVPILAGTDAGALGPQGLSLHRELRRLVEAGLTPQEAISSATSVVAKAFGLPDRGRIAPDLRADMVLVGGDPLARIEDISDIKAVWRGGSRLNRQPGA